MSMLPSVFNAESHKGRMGFNTIPKGRYKAIITKSEMKKTKDHSETKGQYLSLMVKVVEGDHKGAIVFRNLNLVNKNDMAVQIAQNELATICAAVGKASVKDSEELHGKEMWIDVGVEEANGDNPERNTIVNYEALSAGAGAGAAKKPLFGG